MIPVIELFIKCSQYNKEYFGSCPICQTWFMSFYILVENKLIDLKVSPVNIEMQSEDYLKLNVSRKLPVAKVEYGISHDGTDIDNFVAETTDDLEKLISVWKCPQLIRPSDDPEVARAENLSTDILKSLNILLTTKNNKPLISTLSRIDMFLSSKSTKYLMSDKITYPDCILMPRLQHVRVAGKEYFSFDIPTNLKHLMIYIKNMYNEKVFEVTCPKDRDIIEQHKEKVNLSKSRRNSLIKDDSRLMTVDVELLDNIM